jgi:hypothetical protein
MAATFQTARVTVKSSDNFVTAINQALSAPGGTTTATILYATPEYQSAPAIPGSPVQSSITWLLGILWN